jgi:hypothetical protein
MMRISDFFRFLGRNDDGSSKAESGRETNQEPTQFTLAKQRLASNPGTKPEVLDKLATRADAPPIVERVAENSTTDPSTLQKLAQHEEASVRAAVGDNQNTPNEVIEELACDHSLDVRYTLAENPATPRDVLEKLAEDENPYIANRAQQTLGKVLGSVDERKI